MSPAWRRASRWRFVLTPAFWGLLSALLTGCLFSSTPPQKDFYSISYPLSDSEVQHETPRFGATMLRILPIEAAVAYDRYEIVYRNNSHEFRYFWYSHWPTKPSRMLREVIATHLRHANVCGEVGMDVSDRLPDYDLRIELLAIEELNASAELWYARLSMRFELVRHADEIEVWSYSFDERRQTPNKEPIHSVRAMSSILQTEMLHVVGGVEQAIANDRKRRKKKPPPPPQPERP